MLKGYKVDFGGMEVLEVETVGKSFGGGSIVVMASWGLGGCVNRCVRGLARGLQ